MRAIQSAIQGFARRPPAVGWTEGGPPGSAELIMYMRREDPGVSTAANTALYNEAAPAMGLRRETTMNLHIPIYSPNPIGNGNLRRANGALTLRREAQAGENAARLEREEDKNQ